MMVRAGLLAGALLLGASAPALAQANGPGSLTVSMNFYPSTWHPSIEAQVPKTYVTSMARRALTTFGPDWELMCELCEQFPTAENGGFKVVDRPDGTKGADLTFRLKENLFWGDGKPVTAKDFLFTYEIGKTAEAGFGIFDLYAREISSVTVHDDRSFTIHWNGVDCDYQILNHFQPLPEHIERPIFEKAGADYRNRTAYQTDTTNPGLWNGPYRFARVTAGSDVLLVRNEHWKGKRPHFDRIVVRFIENQAALEQNLLSGAVDMVPGENGFSVEQATQLERRHKGRFQVVWKPTLSFNHITLNLENPILADVRVRRALLHAFDREQLVKALYDGRADVAHHFMSPLNKEFGGGFERLGYDPKKADALLTQAGWTRGPDGIRRNAKGEPLVLEFRGGEGARVSALIMQYAQSQWKQLGIDAKLQTEPGRVLFGETLQRRKFGGLVAMGYQTAPRASPVYSIHSKMIPSEANGWSGQNYGGYNDKRMDALVDALDTTCEPDKRLAVWHDLQSHYAAELPRLPLVFPHVPFVMPTWLKGVTPTGHQFPSTQRVEEWYREG